MSRKRRVWYPGAMYHITARGNRRIALFYREEDYLMYLAILEDVRAMYPFVLHSYCLMTNHLHLQIETSQHHIKDIMKELHSRYAIYLNRRLCIDGHLFQGRYRSGLIETDHYFLEVSRYIHRNPLEAKMVKILSHYPWSSYPSYIGLIDSPHVHPSKTQSYFQDPFIESYKNFVESKKYTNQ
ncbi:transposase [Bacillus sp. P14.5]|uniref:transposase n=1 Tax=Bacillus sp. P14.5 TaxID=1983400 RepID=UPI000DEA915A|nr:transposase [Bacillus sp. P14.5]